MEKRYQGRWDKQMMADYYWSIKRDLNNIKHDNQEREIFLIFTKILFRQFIKWFDENSC